MHIQSTPISLLAFVSTAVALLLGGALVARSCLRAAVRRHGTRILHAGTTPQPLAHVDVLKAGFSTRKLPVGIDVIVIGSGVSGLLTAALLARRRKRVLVLEQHDQAGGSTHAFVDHGYEFDVGLHYVGLLLGTLLNGRESTVDSPARFASLIRLLDPPP